MNIPKPVTYPFCWALRQLPHQQAASLVRKIARLERKLQPNRAFLDELTSREKVLVEQGAFAVKQESTAVKQESTAEAEAVMDKLEPLRLEIKRQRALVNMLEKQQQAHKARIHNLRMQAIGREFRIDPTIVATEAAETEVLVNEASAAAEMSVGVQVVNVDTVRGDQSTRDSMMTEFRQAAGIKDASEMEQSAHSEAISASDHLKELDNRIKGKKAEA